MGHVGKGRQVVNVRAWLYAVARNCAIDELRHRSRFADVARDEEGEGLPFTAVDTRRVADPQAVFEDAEAAELVWSSAARRPQPRRLFAPRPTFTKGAVYTRLSRLRDSLEDSVTTTLLVRRGRHDCERLGARRRARRGAPARSPACRP